MTNASEPTLFRLRVAYPKLGRLKYLGHLELIHTVEQIVRRAKLPYAVTQGFSPHMRIAYTSALPVGTSSTAEYFDVYLTELVPAEVALKLLQGAAPVDLRPLGAAYVELRRPALTAEINEVHYLLEVFVNPGFSVTDEAVSQVSLGGMTKAPRSRIVEARRPNPWTFAICSRAAATALCPMVASGSNSTHAATTRARFAPRLSWPPSIKRYVGLSRASTRRSSPPVFRSS